MACSKSIANFEFPRVTYIWFTIFCGVMLVLIYLTYADKFGRFERSVNFWQLFCLNLFWPVFDFSSSVLGTKKVTGGQIWKIRWLRQHYCFIFCQKFEHKQQCVDRGVIMVQKPIFVLPQIRAFLADCFGQIAYNLQVILVIDSSCQSWKFDTNSLNHFLE